MGALISAMQLEIDWPPTVARSRYCRTFFWLAPLIFDLDTVQGIFNDDRYAIVPNRLRTIAEGNNRTHVSWEPSST